MKTFMIKLICIPCGFICAALGIIGMFVPVLPTTPLLLLAGFLFARSSNRLNRWLTSTKAWKTYVQPFVEKQAIPSQTKKRILATSCLVMGVSAYVVKDYDGINFVVWFVLELVLLFLFYLLFVRIPDAS